MQEGAAAFHETAPSERVDEPFFVQEEQAAVDVFLSRFVEKKSSEQSEQSERYARAYRLNMPVLHDDYSARKTQMQAERKLPYYACDAGGYSGYSSMSADGARMESAVPGPCEKRRRRDGRDQMVQEYLHRVRQAAALARAAKSELEEEQRLADTARWHSENADRAAYARVTKRLEWVQVLCGCLMLYVLLCTGAMPVVRQTVVGGCAFGGYHLSGAALRALHSIARRKGLWEGKNVD